MMIRMGESEIHFQVQDGAYQHIHISLCEFTLTVQDARIRQRLEGVIHSGTAKIADKEKDLLKQGDFSFRPSANKLPSLVGEIS